MIRNILLCAAASILIFGCTIFTHATKDPTEFDRDRRDCEQFVANNPDPNATCKADTSTVTEGTAYGLPHSVLPADDATCVTCEAVKRCLEEEKGWKRVKN
jgi:hypothetical protein